MCPVISYADIMRNLSTGVGLTRADRELLIEAKNSIEDAELSRLIDLVFRARRDIVQIPKSELTIYCRIQTEKTETETGV